VVPFAPAEDSAPAVGDVALGAVTRGLALAGRLVRSGASVARPAVGLVLAPPGIPPSLQPGRVAARLGRLGAQQRRSLVDLASQWLDVVVPVVVEEVVRRLDLTAVVRQHVDLDAVVAAVDLDGAAGRLDVDAVAARLDIDAVLNRLDLTTLVRERVDLDVVVGEVDLDAIVRRVDVGAVIDRLDLTELVLQRVDLDAVVGAVDVDGIARRLDVEAVVDRLDLTELVLTKVDLEALVTAVLAHIDLAGLAEEVIDAVDLPEIIRESTGSMASETVRGARIQGIHADEAVGRAVDRLLLRRDRRHPGGPDEPPRSDQPPRPDAPPGPPPGSEHGPAPR
jgi:hypothetical protein